MMGALIDHLWQSSLFAFAAAMLTLAFGKNGANIRFYMWLAASVKFLIPVSVLGHDRQEFAPRNSAHHSRRAGIVSGYGPSSTTRRNGDVQFSRPPP